MTRDRVIAVADAGHGHLGGLQSFYVQISRARDNAVVLTDDRESLAAALEADSGDRLTALEALGEDIALPEEETVERAPLRVPKKLPAAPTLKTDETSVRAGEPDRAALARTREAEGRFEAWRASKEHHDREAAEAERHPALHAGHDKLLSELRELAQDDGLAPETRAAVGQKLARLRAETDAGRVSACMQGLRLALETRAGLEDDARKIGARSIGVRRIGAVDSPGYAEWRLDLETAATAGRAIIANGGLPGLPDGGGREELEALLARADELLAGDDTLFRERTAAGRVRDWHGRWMDAMERIDEPGQAEELDRLVGLGRRIVDDPGLGELDRGHVGNMLAGWKARREAEAAGAAWLAAWNGGGEEERAEHSEDVLEEGRSLAADPAMPEALRQGLLDALRAHDDIEVERAEREAARRTAREAATAARKEADDIAFRLRTGNWTREAETMDGLLARGDRLARSRNLPRVERRRLEEALGRERERRATGLLGAVRALDPEEAWPHALLSRAEAVAHDPKLDDSKRADLETAVGNARRRADAHGRFEEWRRDWNAFVKPIEAARRPVFADEGCKPYVERARALARDPHIGAGAKKTLDLNVYRHDVERPDHVRRYGELLGKWKEVRTQASAQGIDRFDMADSAEIVEEMRKLAASPHLTAKQKDTCRNIAAERDSHLARQQQEPPQLSQRLGRGRSM